MPRKKTTGALKWRRGRRIPSPVGDRMRWTSRCGKWCIESTTISGYGETWVALGARTLVHTDGSTHDGWGWAADSRPVRHRTRAAAERAANNAAITTKKGNGSEP